MKKLEDFKIDFEPYRSALEATPLVKMHGKVTQLIGLTIESEGPSVQMDELCYIYRKNSPNPCRAEVVGFKGNKVLLMPIDDMSGIAPGCEVRASGNPLMIKVGPKLLGRVLDGLGEPIDGKGPIEYETEYPVINNPPNPFQRPTIKKPMALGVRAIDALLTFGTGQRMGIFAGSGVGKSTTLSMIARNTTADINVLTLVGERGRELRDFIEKDLGPKGLARSVVVVATSDRPALVRMKGAYTGTAVAEYFRDQGQDVFLMMDSVTRFAMAQREIGLAIGEPPAQKGYTPSVFAKMPGLLERAGTAPKGSITAIYTVLVDGDDMTEPIADNVRSILDGHIVLSRKIAHANRYPAIDILQSVSRLFNAVTTKEHRAAASKMRDVLSTYKDNEDLINIGAYKDGSNPKVDYAKKMIDPVYSFLKQGIDEPTTFDDTIQRLINMMN